MRATQLLQKQFNMLNAQLHSVLNGLSDDEWTKRGVPRQNLIAYTCWHAVRTIDAEVHVVVRGVPEVASSERWVSHQAIGRPGVGVGDSLEEADAVGMQLSRKELLDYADAVRSSVHLWLKTIDDDELDMVPDLQARLAAAHSIYRTGAHAEVFPVAPDLSALPDKPAWLILLVPCIAHVWQHIGEIEIQREAIRASA